MNQLFPHRKGESMAVSNDLISITHKIELVPNQEAKAHFRKAFGCARLAYNWGLAKWQDYYKQGIKKSHLDLKKEFNAIKKTQFPFVYEVSKCATVQPFFHLNRAFAKFFSDLKKGQISYPQFKKKRENFGSYYISNDQVVIKNEKYLKIPNLGLVKMREKLRFNGKLSYLTISQEGGKFFASFNMQITKEEYIRTHPKAKATQLAVGIDLGLKTFLSLSNGLEIFAPKPLDKVERLIKRRARQLSKKQHAKTKQEAMQAVKPSKNYRKANLKLNKLYRKTVNSRQDFSHKLTSTLVKNIHYFSLEDLNVKGMMQNHHLAKAISDVSFSEFKQQLEYKARYHDRVFYQVDRFYPSSKLCSCCGALKSDLTLKDRVYHCDQCGIRLDRDYNASLNLLSQLEKHIGQVLPKFTPADLTALQEDFAKNLLATSK